MEETIQDVLMYRDGMTLEEANEAIAAAQVEIDNILKMDEDTNPMDMLCLLENVVMDHFGLEPDYLTQFDIF